MPETSKSKRHEAICFQRSLLVADFDYLSSAEVYTFGLISSSAIRAENREKRVENREGFKDYYLFLRYEGAPGGMRWGRRRFRPVFVPRKKNERGTNNPTPGPSPTSGEGSKHGNWLIWTSPDERGGGAGMVTGRNLGLPPTSGEGSRHDNWSIFPDERGGEQA